MNQLITTWQQLSSWGMDKMEGSSYQNQRLVPLCNQINILLIATLIPFIPLQAFIIGATYKSIISLILALSLFVAMLFNKVGWGLAGRLISLFITPIAVFLASFLTKYHIPLTEAISIAEYIEPRIFLLAIIGLPVILLDMKRERSWLFICYAFYFLLLLALNPIDDLFGLSIYTREIDYSNHLTLALSPFLSAIAIVGGYVFLVLMNTGYEQKLVKQNEQLGMAEEEVRQNLEELQAIQERLVNQEKYLSKVLAGLPTAILIIRQKNGVISFVNNATEELLKIHKKNNSKELIGREFISCCVDKEDSEELLNTLHRTRYLANFQLRVYSIGGPRWISLYAVPIQEQNHDSWLISCIDIEMQRHREEELEKQQNALQNKNEELQTLEEELRQNVEELQAQRDFVEQTNKQIRQRNETIEKHSKMLMGLSKHQHIQTGRWNESLELITSSIAQILSISRVSIWQYRAESQSIYCEKLFEMESFAYSDGVILYQKDFPNYFNALRDERIMVANNAHTDPDTSEFTESYLLPLGITSMVDTPFYSDGQLYGVICCEHQGDMRVWKPEEITFIKSMADIISVARNNATKTATNTYMRKSTEVLGELAQSEHLVHGNWELLLEKITSTCAIHSNMSRVSIWEYEAIEGALAQITCLKLYEKEKETFSSGLVLKESDFLPYFNSIREAKPIVASEAREHPATATFSEVYFKPLDIYSLLDVPYFINGKLAGVICCEQQGKVRKWTLEDQLFVKAVADLATVGYQNATQYTQQKALESANTELEATKQTLSKQKDILDLQHRNTMNSIEYAQTIQKAILPAEAVQYSILPQSFVLYKPKDIVSGDFYWLSEIKGRKVLIVADCTGHGVPGAFMSMIGYSLLSEIILQKKIHDPSLILERLHEGIIKALKQEGEGSNDDGMDLGICIMEKGANDMTKVTFEGAKTSLFYIQNDKLEELKGTRRSIGGTKRKLLKPFINKSLLLPKGVMYYMTTDGFQDQNNAKRMRYSTNTLKQLMQDSQGLTMPEQQQCFENSLQKFMGDEEQRDDITLFGWRL